jgi:2-C-methyl-D-erythritol 2,4-cyclodiphosphate synthase
MNVGDIGKHFPDTDKQFKNIDSKILLKGVYEIMQKNNYKIGNVDCTLTLEKPKIAPHISSMQTAIASILNTSIENISIKATTSEKIGFVGREEGVAAYAVVLVEKTN